VAQPIDKEEVNMKSYDVIIAGGGGAGLSLAVHLAHCPLRDRSILVVEQGTKDQNDRTWCFWANRPTLFDDIVYRSWSQLQVLGEHFEKTLDLHEYHYKMIRGIDFYRFARQALSMYPHVEFLQGKVERIEDGDDQASVLVNGQKYTGNWVFDSLFNWSAFKPDRNGYHYLKQQFKGWEIETPENVFNPRVATFLDFRTTQDKGMHFLYVLPLSERCALVESVLYTATPVSWELCEQALRVYLETILGIKAYSTRREEQGISPLTDWPFPRQTGKRIMAIGTHGGMVKPSTGYAFLRMQEDSSAIVRSLLKVGHPFSVPPGPRRYRYFDAVMLELMTHDGESIEPIFTALFKRNPVERIFRFLDEIASPWENFLMIPSLPPQLLLQSLLRLGALRRV
jgi:lycopene beta-cyclase